MSIGHLATQTAANARHQHQALIASTRKGGVRLDENRADEIVAAACSGDGAAFAQLWVALSPRVLAYFRSHGTDDAEDLTSEVFLAAFARIDSFSGDASAFRALVFTIAHRRYVDSVRRRRTHGPMLGLDPELDPRRARSAEADAVGVRAAVDLLASLTEDQRQVVTLRVIADLSVRDTARALGKDEGAVKALQRRALARLRQKVEPTPFPVGGLARLEERHA